MCGIIGYIGEESAKDILVEGLKKLEYRGYDSAGIAVLDNNINIVKTKGKILNLEDKLNDVKITGHIGIGHTRWATHGEPSHTNSHPHCNEDNTITIVHNGIIENYIMLKNELVLKGYNFQTQTDTEVVVHLIDYYYKQSGDIIHSMVKASDRLQGSYAIVVLCQDYDNNLFVMKKDSPLIIGEGNNNNYIASDIPAILKYTRDIYILEDNEIAIISQNSVDIMDKYQSKVERDILRIDWDMKAAEKDGYAHFMLKEIFEQPKVIQDTLKSRLNRLSDNIVLDDILLTVDDMNKVNKVYMVGCGTASYACLIGKHILEKVVRVPVVVEPASEFRYRDPIIDESTLVVVVSQSGETADTLAALRMAKKSGARVISIVNVVGSTIAREADDILYIWAGPEIAVASTKAYTCQLVAIYMLSLHIAMLKKKITTAEYREIRDEICNLSNKISVILNDADYIKGLANRYSNAKNVFYVGRGLDYAVCMEGSLKLKEIAYIHSEPYAAGELKHGPIALIEKGTLVVGLACQEELNDKVISNLKEVKARGAEVLIIAMEGNEKIKDVADNIIYIPRTNPLLAPILENIPQQLLAYHMAVALGNDVDKPRNLAKSVTVE